MWSWFSRDADHKQYLSREHVPFQWAAKETNGLHGRSGILEARMSAALPFMCNVLQSIESAFESGNGGDDAAERSSSAVFTAHDSRRGTRGQLVGGAVEVQLANFFRKGLRKFKIRTPLASKHAALGVIVYLFDLKYLL